jgi:rubrerythrin
MSIPLEFNNIDDMIEGAIAEEKEAIDDYARIINRLDLIGFPKEAEIVKEIRDDEIDHRNKFEKMIKELLI